MEKLILKKQTIGNPGVSHLHVIVLVIMFVISLLISALLGLIGNVVVSLICGAVASYIASNEKRTTFGKILPIFSFLAVLEAATFLCLKGFLSGTISFNPTLIIMGLSFSTVLFIIGWIIGERWQSLRRF